MPSSHRWLGVISIVVADDQRLVREGLAELLAAHFEVLGHAADGLEAIDLCRRMPPDVALVDVVMPTMGGPECTHQLLTKGLAGKVIAITTYDADEHVVEMIGAGASGFVLKDIEVSELVAAIRAVYAGNSLLAPATLTRLIGRFAQPQRALPTGCDSLTDREHEVLRHVARGLTNAEVAAAMFLSESTVKTHIGRLFTKLRCRDRAQLVIFAYEAGLVRPGS